MNWSREQTVPSNKRMCCATQESRRQKNHEDVSLEKWSSFLELECIGFGFVKNEFLSHLHQYSSRQADC